MMMINVKQLQVYDIENVPMQNTEKEGSGKHVYVFSCTGDYFKEHLKMGKYLGHKGWRNMSFSNERN